MKKRRSHLPACLLAIPGIAAGIVIRHLTGADDFLSAALMPAGGGVAGTVLGLFLSRTVDTQQN
ncbi:MAG: hypothetical protein KDA96_06670 [Planctomycetaceae bacterium]|nr:hypothetical protein [Planctomycetaceae bacterium]